VQIVRINRRGNSLGVNLPRPYLKELGWGVGVYLMLEIQGGSLVFSPLNLHHIQAHPNTQDRTEAFHATQQD